jgi:hypothetical protein
MPNKYLYSLLKDNNFRVSFIFSIIGIVICVLLIHIDKGQSLELKNIQIKQALIAQIPAMQAKIAQTHKAVNGLVLNGIVSDKAQPMAVINNQLLKVGEEIDGRTVVAITDDKVKVCNVKMMDQCIELLLE